MREWGRDRTDLAGKRWHNVAAGVALAVLVAILLLWPLFGYLGGW